MSKLSLYIYRACIPAKLYMYIFHIIFCFQGAAATVSCECDHNSGLTSTSANQHDIGPFQCSPNQHASTLLGELAFFQLVITRVLLLYRKKRKKEKHSQERKKAWLRRVQVSQSPNIHFVVVAMHACIVWTFIDLNFNPPLSLVVGLVGELLLSTSTSYSDSTTAPSPHLSPPHSTQ